MENNTSRKAISELQNRSNLALNNPRKISPSGTSIDAENSQHELDHDTSLALLKAHEPNLPKVITIRPNFTKDELRFDA